MNNNMNTNTYMNNNKINIINRKLVLKIVSTLLQNNK